MEKDKLMKKVVFLASLTTLAFQSDATLTLEGWGEKSYMFNSNTNLIYGYVLSKSKLPENMRYFGNIKCDTSVWDGNNPNICSYKDEGLDFVYKLLIQLFPSAGVEFNPEGRGSLSDKISKFSKLDLVDVIAGMFKIDANVREKGENSDIFKIECFKNNDRTKLGYRAKKRFLKNYFNLKSQDPEKYNKLFDLSNNIANAIQIEKKGGILDFEDKNKSYPPFFTNYLICAYAWNILNDDQLKLLAEKLGYTEERAPFKNEFSYRVINDAKMLRKMHWVPFNPGERIISNNEVIYNGQHFADCVETTLRLFCASVFCKLTESTDKKGQKIGKLVLDPDRIPEKATALREFFAPEGVPRDIYGLVNDSTQETRNAWAEIVSGHPNVRYRLSGDCELDTGWINFIKIFCRLMDGYSELNGSKSAADRIKAINDGTFSLTQRYILETLNTLLKIRTDVKMIAEEKTNLEFKNNDVFGKISIYPNLNLAKNNEYIIGLNRLNFSQSLEHAGLQDIPNNQRKNTDSRVLWHFESLPWIEKLYHDQVKAIRGKRYGEKYPMLRNSRYPLLEYPFRIGGGVRHEWIHDSITEMFCSSTPHMDTIFRKNINNPFVSDLLFKLSIHENGEIKLFSVEDGFIDLPSPERIRMLWKSPLVSKTSKMLSYIVTCLENLAPGEASTLFLEKDENGKERLNVNLTDKTSIDKLIALRVATKHCSEIDPFIEKFIEKSYKKALEEDEFYRKNNLVDNNYECNQWREFYNNVLKIFEKLREMSNKRADIPRFQRSTFDIFMKYLNFIPFSQINNAYGVRQLVQAFDLMDYDEENTTFIKIWSLEKARRDKELKRFMEGNFWWSFS